MQFDLLDSRLRKKCGNDAVTVSLHLSRGVTQPKIAGAPARSNLIDNNGNAIKVIPAPLLKSGNPANPNCVIPAPPLKGGNPANQKAQRHSRTPPKRRESSKLKTTPVIPAKAGIHTTPQKKHRILLPPKLGEKTNDRMDSCFRRNDGK